MNNKFYARAPAGLVACDDGLHYILLDETSAHCNWVMRSHPNGGLVSVRTATEHELAQAKARLHLRDGVGQIESGRMKMVDLNNFTVLAQRLREYNHNPHHINPTSEAFHKLIDDAANALAAQRDEGLAREAELNSKLAALIKDRARFPDRPYFVGQMIGCSIGNLEKRAHSAEESLRWRHHQIEALQQRLAEAEKPQPLFVATVLRKLRRFEECASDGEGADIERHWFDILTHLGLLNRVQHSPAWWELTDEGEQFLASPGCADGEKP